MKDFHVITIEAGNTVICDDCGVDWTHLPDSGGLLFLSKAICPECAPRWRESAAKYGEQVYIRQTCPPDKSFADWVRDDLR